MTRITLETLINAPIETCFDLSRNADVHLLSTTHTQERVVAGRASGLFELGDEVTWEAVHLGVRQRLSTKITKFDTPVFFEDTMQKGAFKSMRHEHHFCKIPEGTLMTDVFEYEAPFGLAGKIFGRLYLKQYMIRLLRIRNNLIKELAEQK
jgi:ligand-binding SRPBCC domain-containing protein